MALIQWPSLRASLEFAFYSFHIWTGLICYTCCCAFLQYLCRAVKAAAEFGRGESANFGYGFDSLQDPCMLLTVPLAFLLHCFCLDMRNGWSAINKEISDPYFALILYNSNRARQPSALVDCLDGRFIDDFAKGNATWSSPKYTAEVARDSLSIFVSTEPCWDAAVFC